MKKFSLVTVAALCGAALSLTPGCTTVQTTNPDGTTSTSKVPNVAAMSSIAQSAVYIGTTVYLNGIPPTVAAHPQDRAAFETARTSLRALIAAGTFSASDLTASLQALPIKQLQGSSGTLIVGEAVILWDQYGQELVSLDKAQVFDTYILPVAKSILAGLDQALGPN